MPNHKLTAVDAANFLPGNFPPLVAQVLFGLALAVAMILLRSAIDLVAPNAGPFALVYPMVLIATLFGRRIHTPDIAAKGPRSGFARRAAINAPLQGAAAAGMRAGWWPRCSSAGAPRVRAVPGCR